MVRRLLGRRVRAVVLAPEPEFTYRQYAVAEPFSYGEVARFDLGDLVSKAGGRLRQDALAGVDGGREDRLHRCRRRNPLRRARHRRRRREHQRAAGSDHLPRTGEQSRRPPGHAWRSTEARSRAWLSPCRLPATGRCRSMSSRSWPPLTWPTCGDGSEAIDLITAEKEPLDVFGAGASQRLRAELDRVGVRLHTGVAPARVAAGGLTLMDGSVVPLRSCVCPASARGFPTGRGGAGTTRLDLHRLANAGRRVPRRLRRRRCQLVSDQAGWARRPAGRRGGDGDRRGH